MSIFLYVLLGSALGGVIVYFWLSKKYAKIIQILILDNTAKQTAFEDANG